MVPEDRSQIPVAAIAAIQRLLARVEQDRDALRAHPGEASSAGDALNLLAGRADQLKRALASLVSTDSTESPKRSE